MKRQHERSLSISGSTERVWSSTGKQGCSQIHHNWEETTSNVKKWNASVLWCHSKVPTVRQDWKWLPLKTTFTRHQPEFTKQQGQTAASRVLPELVRMWLWPRQLPGWTVIWTNRPFDDPTGGAWKQWPPFSCAGFDCSPGTLKVFCGLVWWGDHEWIFTFRWPTFICYLKFLVTFRSLCSIRAVFTNLFQNEVTKKTQILNVFFNFFLEFNKEISVVVLVWFFGTFLPSRIPYLSNC